VIWLSGLSHVRVYCTENKPAAEGEAAAAVVAEVKPKPKPRPKPKPVIVQDPQKAHEPGAKEARVVLRNLEFSVSFVVSLFKNHLFCEIPPSLSLV